jgi:predicted RNA binding protein YcfA (HicA-like mRNA interferase family)
MKRGNFIELLKREGMDFFKHGTEHDIYKNRITGKQVTVPRHGEIDNNFIRKVLKQTHEFDNRKPR